MTIQLLYLWVRIIRVIVELSTSTLNVRSVTFKKDKMGIYMGLMEDKNVNLYLFTKKKINSRIITDHGLVAIWPSDHVPPIRLHICFPLSLSLSPLSRSLHSRSL